jgi:hypothetical protein
MALNSEQELLTNWAVGDRVWIDTAHTFHSLGTFTPDTYDYFVQSSGVSKGAGRAIQFPLGGEIWVLTESRTGTDDDRRRWGPTRLPFLPTPSRFIRISQTEQAGKEGRRDLAAAGQAQSGSARRMASGTVTKASRPTACRRSLPRAASRGAML